MSRVQDSGSRIDNAGYLGLMILDAAQDLDPSSRALILKPEPWFHDPGLWILARSRIRDTGSMGFDPGVWIQGSRIMGSGSGSFMKIHKDREPRQSQTKQGEAEPSEAT